MNRGYMEKECEEYFFLVSLVHRMKIVKITNDFVRVKVRFLSGRNKMVMELERTDHGNA